MPDPHDPKPMTIDMLQTKLAGLQIPDDISQPPPAVLAGIIHALVSLNLNMIKEINETRRRLNVLEARTKQ